MANSLRLERSENDQIKEVLTLSFLRKIIATNDV